MSAFLLFDTAVVLKWNEFLLSNPALQTFALGFGLLGAYFIPVLWLVYWFWRPSLERRLVLLSSIASGIIAWQVLDRMLKYLHFQQRPIHSLPVQELLFERPENSFPSDHAAFLAGIACFFLLVRRTKPGIVLAVLALLVGLSRIALAVHYPTDILVGFISGAVSAWVIYLFHTPISKKIWEPLINTMKKIKLA